MDFGIKQRVCQSSQRADSRTVVRFGACTTHFDDELHGKIVLVDDKELYIGSANLVATSLERNKEAGIHTINHDTALDAGDYLIDAFDDAFRKRLLK